MIYSSLFFYYYSTYLSPKSLLNILSAILFSKVWTIVFQFCFCHLLQREVAIKQREELSVQLNNLQEQLGKQHMSSQIHRGLDSMSILKAHRTQAFMLVR